jgi:hypothetical protein
MQTIKLSQVMQANKWLRRREAEAKRERKFQRTMYDRLVRFVHDEAESVLEEFNKVVKSSGYEQR